MLAGGAEEALRPDPIAYSLQLAVRQSTCSRSLFAGACSCVSQASGQLMGRIDELGYSSAEHHDDNGESREGEPV